MVMAIGRLSPELKLNMYFFLYASPILQLVYEISRFVEDRPVSPSKRFMLLQRVIDSGDKFIEWYRTFDDKMDRVDTITSCMHIDTMHQMSERGTYFIPYMSVSISQCIILIQSRLRVALGSGDAYRIESDTQMMASRLSHAASADGKPPAWKTPLAGNVIPAIPATANDWMGHAMQVHCSQPGVALDVNEVVIGKAAFWRWMSAMNIRTGVDVMNLWDDYDVQRWTDRE